MEEHHAPMFGSVFLSQISAGFEEGKKAYLLAVLS